MAVDRVRAGTDADGRLTAWHQQIVAAPTSVNLLFVRDVMFTNGVDFFTTTGAVDPPYAVENFRLESTNFESSIPTMVWRSVGNSHTEFARESAIDERAIAPAKTPVDLCRDPWRAARERCERSSSQPSAPIGDHGRPRAGHVGSRAPASSATAPM